MVPNGKLLGKYMGDKYPLEDALAAREAAAAASAKDGPGGRLFGSDYEYRKDPLKDNATFSFEGGRGNKAHT